MTQQNQIAEAYVKPSKRSGGVNFALDKTMFIESSYNAMDEDQLWEVFYAPEDFQAFRDEIEAIVRRRRKMSLSKVGRRRGANSNDDDDDNEYCFRGLESRSTQGARRKNSMRIRARQAVLQEQSRQKVAKEYDVELLAEIYKGFGIISSSQAQRLAQMDAAYSRKQMMSGGTRIVVDQLPTMSSRKIPKDDECDTISTCSSSGNYSISSADTMRIGGFLRMST